MGAIVDDESKGIAEIQALSQEAKGVMSHHFRNIMQHIILGVEMDDKELIKKSLAHWREDLVRFGL